MTSVIEKSLICNFKRCNMLLTSTAWISSCSHIFCDEHSPVYEIDKKCTLCSSDLNGRYDLIQNDLNPSEETKSMMLAGLNPTNILEIGSKAMTFWNFQTFQERMYLTTLVKHLRSRLAQAECSYENMTEKLKVLVQQESQKRENLEKELHNFVRKAKDLEEKVDIKNRELINMHNQYQALQKQMEHFQKSSYLDINQTSASTFQEHMSQALPPTKFKEPVSKAVFRHQEQHKLPNNTKVSLSQPSTPKNKMWPDQRYTKQQVFSYKHLPSKPSRLPFNSNQRMTNQQLGNTTPLRQSQTHRLFPS